MKNWEKNLSSVEGLINIARKAGFVIVGGENLSNYTKKLYLLIMDNTAGNSLKREMQFLSEKRNLKILTVDNLSKIVGIENCKAIGIKNKSFAENIEKCLKGE
jgi:hypothetical protein